MVVLIDDGCTKVVQQNGFLNCVSGKFGTAEYCIGGTVLLFGYYTRYEALEIQN